ncbi:MAG: hypothetical protein GTN53_22155 [Candidatus Aminicenantes bacterium]|nr:hypothetical protein [Candidatus Aminicenantes bacterium]NIQ69206.1 hypothetical protein [Candidatus Aminicenantes bacterium]NIT25209.1 hypothetical protein [Candidatus Aminicenantes bacterium]
MGGNRRGSANKPVKISQGEKKKLLKKLKMSAKGNNKTIWENLVITMFHGVNQRMQLTAIKIYQDAVMAVHRSRGSIDHKCDDVFFPDLYHDSPEGKEDRAEVL